MGEINSTAQTRISRTSRSRLICTASSNTCATITPASNVRDLCLEGIAIIESLSPVAGYRPGPRWPFVRDAFLAAAFRRALQKPNPNALAQLVDRDQPQQPE